jgi:starch-binding outer membrane protein, SusD/RagB family
MRRHLVAALALGLAIGTAACDDEFLTTLPQAEISDAAFWQTQRDFTMAVTAAYRNLLDTDQVLFEGASDFMYSKKDWTAVHAYAMGHQDATTGWSGGIWDRLFQGISRANTVLNQLEATDANLPAAFRTEIQAQARFLRGNFYHELLWLYGDVPLFDKVPTVEEAREVSRSSRDEVFNFLLADLQAAAQGLPESWPASQYGRATKGAALAYIARAALYEASYQKYHLGNATRAEQLFRVAADAAQDVMDLGIYGLYPDYRGLFTYAGEGSSEVIFDYQHVQGVNGWSAFGWFAPHSRGGVVDIHPTRALVDQYRMTDGLTIEDSPLYDPAPPVIEDGEVVSLGMYANRDPRLYATVIFPGAEFMGAVFNPYPDSPTPDHLDRSNFNNTETGFVLKKYVDPEDVDERNNSGINIIKMRYADVLLMYAEAKIELGEWAEPSVEAALNELRDRVDMPDVELTSQQQAIDLVRNERAVELATEGLRLADIRRWGVAEEVMPGQPAGMDIWDDGEIVTVFGTWQRSFTAPRDYLWPVPIGELDLNPNMTQNPGYGGAGS